MIWLSVAPLPDQKRGLVQSLEIRSPRPFPRDVPKSGNSCPLLELEVGVTAPNPNVENILQESYQKTRTHSLQFIL
jgi:hypothetical protein